MRLLAEYQQTLAPEQRRPSFDVEVFYFCSDEKSANTCADLVTRGIKTATCSLRLWYERGAPYPRVGTWSIVTDWEGRPACIIDITSIEECRFCDVTDQFAQEEGEGDKSLTWWRNEHRAFFTRECAELQIEFDDTLPLVLERFRVIHRAAGK